MFLHCIEDPCCACDLKLVLQLYDLHFTNFFNGETHLEAVQTTNSSEQSSTSEVSLEPTGTVLSTTAPTTGLSSAAADEVNTASGSPIATSTQSVSTVVSGVAASGAAPASNDRLHGGSGGYVLSPSCPVHTAIADQT